MAYPLMLEIGYRRGGWTIIGGFKRIFSEEAQKNNYYWECRCDCGTVQYVIVTTLRRGTPHCRKCRTEAQRAAVTSHGMRRTPIYAKWQQMIRRCTDEKREGYRHYGGRGITVCDRWLHSFENFYEDMKDGFSKELSLERIENNGNYQPGNCCWIPLGEQAKNRRPSSEWRKFTRAKNGNSD